MEKHFLLLDHLEAKRLVFLIGSFTQDKLEDTKLPYEERSSWKNSYSFISKDEKTVILVASHVHMDAIHAHLVDNGFLN